MAGNRETPSPESELLGWLRVALKGAHRATDLQATYTGKYRAAHDAAIAAGHPEEEAHQHAMASLGDAHAVRRELSVARLTEAERNRLAVYRRRGHWRLRWRIMAGAAAFAVFLPFSLIFLGVCLRVFGWPTAGYAQLALSLLLLGILLPYLLQHPLPPADAKLAVRLRWYAVNSLTGTFSVFTKLALLACCWSVPEVRAYLEAKLLWLAPLLLLILLAQPAYDVWYVERALRKERTHGETP